MTQTTETEARLQETVEPLQAKIAELEKEITELRRIRTTMQAYLLKLYVKMSITGVRSIQHYYLPIVS